MSKLIALPMNNTSALQCSNDSFDARISDPAVIAELVAVEQAEEQRMAGLHHYFKQELVAKKQRVEWYWQRRGSVTGVEVHGRVRSMKVCAVWMSIHSLHNV